MEELRKRGLVGVWLVFLPFLLVCQTSWTLLLAMNGWPGIKFHHLPQLVSRVMVAVTTLLSNLPDLISAALYVMMLIHFRKLNNLSVHPALNHEDVQGRRFF